MGVIMKIKSFSMSPELVKRLEKLAKSKGISQSRFMETALLVYLTMTEFAPEQSLKLHEMVNANQVNMLDAIDKAIQSKGE